MPGTSAQGNISTSRAVAISMRATFNGTTIAESNDTVVVEGNHYFPTSSVLPGVLVDSQQSTVCPWKGTAAYYDVVVEGTTAANGAWYYPEPTDAAAQIADRLAFHQVVSVTE